MTHQLARFSIAAHEDPAVLFMPIELVKMLSQDVIGHYRIDGIKNRMPERALYLQPAAAESYLTELTPVNMEISDMLRSAESSLNARARGRGAQRPSYSGHNFGWCIDVKVTVMLKKLGMSKRQFNAWMAERGWYCHRRDARRDAEEWHYNYFGNDYDKWVKKNDRKTSSGLERMITKTYGRWWHRQTKKDAQRMLTRLGMYDGDIDGAIGPISREGIKAFQRAWLIKKRDGTLDVMTKRTLAFVSSDRLLVSV